MKITPERARRIAPLGAFVLRALGATWRVRFSGFDVDYFKPNYVYAFLHGDMLMPALILRKVPAAVIISEHGDGAIIAEVLKRLGSQHPIRGSTTRGGTNAVKRLVREMQNRPWAVTPDGPRGPRGSVQDGVIYLASQSGRPIMPAGFAVSRAKYLQSWDRFVIPAPFARIVVFVSEPMSVPPDIDCEAVRQSALELENRLRSATEEAARVLGRGPEPIPGPMPTKLAKSPELDSQS